MEMQIKVSKQINLMPDETLTEFVSKIHESLAVNRARTKLSLYVSAIYSSYIIASDHEDGSLYKFDFTRDESGGVVLGDPVEVKIKFVPVDVIEKSDADAMDLFNFRRGSLWSSLFYKTN